MRGESTYDQFRFAIHHLFMWTFGAGFLVYSFLAHTATGSLYALFGVVAGVLILFNHTDRNHYRSRLKHLQESVEELETEIEVQRTEYTDYELEEKE